MFSINRTSFNDIKDYDDLGRRFNTNLRTTKPYITNVRRIFLSQPVLITDKLYKKRVHSEPNIQYNVNYDDLCGPWILPNNPAYKKTYDKLITPKLCTWTLVAPNDVAYMKEHQNNKTAILSLIRDKISGCVIFNDNNTNIFLILIWEVFQFTRDNYFTGTGVSAALGVFYLAHRFFLSHSRRTADETYSFFYKSLLLHAVMNPPESDEIFTPAECKQLLELFWTTYMQQLSLIQFVCLPNYRIIMKLEKTTADTHAPPSSSTSNTVL